MGSLYDTDFAVWSAEQASAIRDAGRRRVNAPIDWDNVAEEIESLGISQRLTLRSRIGTIIEHLLKLQVSPANEPERLWRETVLRTRRDIEVLLRNSPSLRREVADMIEDEMASTRTLVRTIMADYGETPRQPVETIIYDEAAILGDWLPDRTPPPA
ncbi:MAG TPA: DUF29 domain-containing protein [Acetobacteraceae bacterium]